MAINLFFSSPFAIFLDALPMMVGHRRQALIHRKIILTRLHHTEVISSVQFVGDNSRMATVQSNTLVGRVQLLRKAIQKYVFICKDMTISTEAAYITRSGEWCPRRQDKVPGLRIETSCLNGARPEDSNGRNLRKHWVVDMFTRLITFLPFG